MAENPIAETMRSTEDAIPMPWPEIAERLGEDSDHWLATVRPDERPHVVPVGAVWMEGAMYFTTGQGTRKEKNLEGNPRCVITMSARGFDLVVEGDAAKISDPVTLERLAEVYRAQGWPATVRDGAFDAPYSAPTTGPAPYEVYKVTPTTVFALGTEESTVNHCTRYRF